MIWLWHTLFDGTRLCGCETSRRYRTYLKAEGARQRRALRAAEQHYRELRRAER